MKRVLIDEGVPHQLREWIESVEVFSVQWLGWAGIKNGELILRVNDGGFNVVITNDQQWSYQQNRSNWGFGVIELSTNSLPILLQAANEGDLIARLNHAVQTIALGETIEFTVEDNKGGNQ